jgi:N-acetylglucosamine malate deacetylase 1
MNPYESFVASFSKLVEEGKSLPLGGFSGPPAPVRKPNAPTALFFAPHPDDECISGGLALRVLRQTDMRVVNVAVTQGSKKERQCERWQELKAACDFIGFNLEATGPNGLEKINAQIRQQDPRHWAQCVKVILRLLQKHQPRVIFFPHEHDWNSTHIGTYHLVMDALTEMPANYECYAVETEFWGQMASPNLMVELSAPDLASLIAATSFHIGEVKRNPYHLLLPAWMLDNVRRGTELVGGQGGVAPDFKFAALYRLRKWKNGQMHNLFEGGRQISSSANIGELFT